MNTLTFVDGETGAPIAVTDPAQAAALLAAGNRPLRSDGKTFMVAMLFGNDTSDPNNWKLDGTALLLILAPPPSQNIIPVTGGPSSAPPAVAAQGVTVQLGNPPEAQQAQVATIADLSTALDAGYRVLWKDGTLATTQIFAGGYLVNGNPLNVILGFGWLVGQREQIAQGIAAGQIANPQLLMVNSAVLPAGTDLGPTPAPAALAGAPAMPGFVLVGGLILVGYLLLRR